MGVEEELHESIRSVLSSPDYPSLTFDHNRHQVDVVAHRCAHSYTPDVASDLDNTVAQCGYKTARFSATPDGSDADGRVTYRVSGKLYLIGTHSGAPRGPGLLSFLVTAALSSASYFLTKFACEWYSQQELVCNGPDAASACWLPWLSTVG